MKKIKIKYRPSCTSANASGDCLFPVRLPEARESTRATFVKSALKVFFYILGLAKATFNILICFEEMMMLSNVGLGRSLCGLLRCLMFDVELAKQMREAYN